ncbi:MAG: HNH endonuclease signature motif containing protein [bacterium]
MQPGLYIYKKEVDWSALHEGLTIPVTKHGLFYDKMNLKLKHGEHRTIKLLIDGQEFQAELINQGFDRKKYPTHPEMLQIRYRKNGELSKHLQVIFSFSFIAIVAIKARGKHRPRQQIKLPENEREYMAFYSTDFDDTFAVDCITHTEIVETGKIVCVIPELEIEQILQSDKTASILENFQTVKIRRLDRTIGESLKWLYDNRCQICDLAIGEKYNATIIHTHHIDYFSRSLNNDASNIMVMCRNPHGIIHAVNRTFNCGRLSFTYPNGLVECLKLNRHL